MNPDNALDPAYFDRVVQYWHTVLERIPHTAYVDGLRKHTPQWIWRTGAFAGEFGDAYINNTNLEGGDVPSTLELMVHAMVPLLRAGSDLGKMYLPLLTEEDKKGVRGVMKDLEAAVELGRELNHMRFDSKLFVSFLSRWMNRVRTMEVGGRLIINGGWLVAYRTRPPRGHAAFYVVERDEENSFAFTVVNTGEGNELHPVFRSDYPKEKRRAAIRIGNITRSHILQEAFWYLLFKMRFYPSSVHGPEMLYEVLLPYIANAEDVYAKPGSGKMSFIPPRAGQESDDDETSAYDLTFAPNLDQQIRAGMCGDFETTQRSGTCFFRSILSCLRYCCKRIGLEEKKRKQITYALRLSLLFRTEYDLTRLRRVVDEAAQEEANVHRVAAESDEFIRQRISAVVPDLSGGWQHSDVKMISMACNVTSLAAVKEARRGSLTKDGLYHIRALTNRLRDHCTVLGPGAGAPHSIQGTGLQEVVGEQSAAWAEVKAIIEGCDDLACAFSDDELKQQAGVTSETPPVSFVDMHDPLMHTSDVRWTFEAVEGLLSRVVDQCEALHAKSASSSASVAMHQVCALVEHAFTSVLPMPPPASSVVRLQRCVWAETCISLERQRSVLNLLRKCALHYAAASFNMPCQDRATWSARVAVLWSIMARFDALMRVVVEGSKTASPLACALFHSTKAHARPYWISTSGFSDATTLEESFSTMIFHQPHLAATMGGALSYFLMSDPIENIKHPGRNTTLLFDWFSDNLRQLTQFRVEQGDAMLEFITFLRGHLDGHVPRKLRKRDAPSSSSSSTAKAQAAKPPPIQAGPGGGPPPPPPIPSPARKEPSTTAPSSRSSRNKPSNSQDRGGFLEAIRASRGDPISARFIGKGGRGGRLVLPGARAVARIPGRTPKTVNEAERQKIRSFEELLDWFCGDEAKWTESSCPEYVWLRDVVFLCKLALEPSDGLYKRNDYFAARNFSPSSLIAVWTHKDATVDKVKMGVHIASQPKLGLASAHPRSPVDPQRFVPPTLSAIPQQPHLLAVLLSGKEPTDAQMKRGMQKPETATVNEEDMQHMASIPTFNNTLSETESVELLSLLTVPYTNIPLVLSFFANNLTGALVDNDLRHILESVLFEPRAFNPRPDPIVNAPVPQEKRARQLGTVNGMLLHEMSFEADASLKPLLEMLESGVRLCIGTNRSSFPLLLLFLTRTAVRVMEYRLHAEKSRVDDCCESRVMPQLVELLRTSVLPSLFRLQRTATEEEDLSASVLIRTHLVTAIEFLIEHHNHVQAEADADTATHSFLTCAPNDTSISAVLLHAAFVISWHSKANEEAQALSQKQPKPLDKGPQQQKVKKKKPNRQVEELTFHGPLSGVPLAATFLAVQRMRGLAIASVAFTPQSELFNFLSLMAQLALQLIGQDHQPDGSEPQDMLTNSNALMDSLAFSGAAVGDEWLEVSNDVDLECGSPARLVGVFRHSVGLEVNLQTAEVHFHHRSLVPTPTGILGHPHFSALVGTAAPYCVVVDRTEYRQCVQVLHDNVCFHAQAWSARPLRNWSLHPRLPKRMESGMVEHRSRLFELWDGDESCWFTRLFKPLLVESAKSTNIKLKQVTCWIDGAYARNERPADVYHHGIVMVMHVPPTACSAENITARPGVFYEIEVTESRGVFHVYALFEHGRNIRRSLVFTSDCRWARAYFAPSCEKRLVPWAPGTQFAAGNMFAYLVTSDGNIAPAPESGPLRDNNVHSVVVKRACNVRVDGALRPAMEEFVPREALIGFIPEPLLDAYWFWRITEPLKSNGHERVIIRGYPRTSDECLSGSGKTLLSWWGDAEGIEVTIGGAEGGALVRRVVMQPEPEKNHEDGDAPRTHREYLLLDALSADPTSTVGIIIEKMVQLDSASHVLVWSESRAHGGEHAEISVVELPRLKLRFAMQEMENRDGSVSRRLFSLDHSDLFMCSDEVSLRSVEKFSSCLIHGLVMQNRFEQLFLLVPNYGLKRVDIRSCPFSSPLVSVRDDENWRNQVRTTYYLYPIHGSGSFMVMSSLAGALYMVLLRLLRRDYAEASNLLGSCASDSAFTEEERWVLSHVKISEGDSHPNAHAVRLRLATICLEHSSDVVTGMEWEVEEDLHGYLQKFAHVSSLCRLTTEEERLLLEFIVQVQDGRIVAFTTTLRLRYLTALAEAKRTNETQKLKLPTQMRYGGTKLRALYVHAHRFCKSRLEQATGHLYYNYRRPCGPHREVSGVEAVDLLQRAWDDNMYGQTNQTGFLLLYEMLLGRVHVRICPEITAADVTQATPPRKDAMPHRVLQIESEEGLRNRTSCLTMAKLMIHSLFFRYVTPRGLPPDSGLSFALLPLVLTLVESDRRSERAVWNLPSLPYSRFLPLMEAEKTGPRGRSLAGFWGDKAPNDCADEFEDSLTEAVVQHCNTSLWREHPSFTYARLEYPNFFSERGHPALIVINPADRLECRPEIAEFTCEEQVLREFSVKEIEHMPGDGVDSNDLQSLNFSKEDVTAFSHAPMEVMDLQAYVEYVSVDDAEQRDISRSSLPFDGLKGERAAEALVARSMLQRMQQDVAQSVKDRMGEKIPELKCLARSFLEELRQSLGDVDLRSNSLTMRTSKLLRTALENLSALREVLLRVMQADRDAVHRGVRGVELLANQFPVEPTAGEVATDTTSVVVNKLSFLLEREAGVKSYLDFHLLCRALMCPDPWATLSQYNPFLTEPRCKRMLGALSGVLLRSIRVAQANSCVAGISHLITLVKRALELEVELAASFLSSSGSVGEWSISAAMKRHALTQARYDIEAASNELTDLCAELSTFRDVLDESISSDARTSLSHPEKDRLAYLVMHLKSFDIKQASEFLSKANPKQLLDLTERGCCYEGKRLVTLQYGLGGQSGSSDGLATGGGGGVAPMLHLVQHTAERVASVLAAERHYMGHRGDGALYDPRFLVFEFVSNFMLRKRQVELVREFAESARSGGSSVHQMIMGAGKTTVICPLLSLLLADGNSLVTLVVPAALLDMSRTVMRSCFSNVITKRVYSFHFDRYSSSKSANQLADVKRLRVMLEVARAQRGVVCTTPESVKSLMLMKVDVLAALDVYEREHVVALFADEELVEEDVRAVTIEQQRLMRTIAEIARIMQLWGKEESGVVLLDEVDVILHPLHSELNFPIGDKKPLPSIPFRWQLPFHLFRGLTGTATEGDSKLLEQLKEKLVHGERLNFIQRIPHLVLLDRSFYAQHIVPLMGEWALEWLLHQRSVLEDRVRCGDRKRFSGAVLSYICTPDGSSVNREHGLVSIATPPTIQACNLARDWIVSFLPHCLSKIDRVHFGLLQPRDISRWSAVYGEGAGEVAAVRGPRQLLAVPFVGKDVPSQASEFAHPDVLIGLSILAYQYEGLRQDDVRALVRHLKERLSMEAGPYADRPSNLLFERWLRDAKASRQEGRMEHTHDVPSEEELQVLPLEVLQIEDQQQMKSVELALGLRAEVVEFYLDQVVFPCTMHHQTVKLQASGQDLGSNMVFGARLGFSGTPSDVLPRLLRPCHYELGSEATVLRTLTHPSFVSVEIVHDWNVESLLQLVTRPEGGYNALIDAGALITGMNNEQAARALLHSGIPHLEGCVFLDDLDRKMIVDRTNAPPVPLGRSGIPMEKRFTFFDQVHTTGMDIAQPIDACAAVLLGKDMTFRDYAQACWRMRGLGRGQSIHALVVKEVHARIVSVADTGELRSDIVSWLLLNSIRSEHLQQTQLCVQDLSSTWRKGAYAQLRSTALTDDDVMVTAKKLEEDVTIKKPKFHGLEMVSNAAAIVGDSASDVALRNLNQRCLSVFKESLDYAVPDHPPQQEALHTRIQEQFAKHEELVPEAEKEFFVEVLEELKTLEREAPLMDQHSQSYDSEIVQEQEQQQQQQQQTATGAEVEYGTEKEALKYWSINSLFEQHGRVSEFVKLSSISLWSMFSPRDKVSLQFPDDVLISPNHTSTRHRSHLQRRLKSCYVALAQVTHDSSGARHFCSTLVTLKEAEAVRMFLASRLAASRNYRSSVSLYLTAFRAGHWIVDDVTAAERMQNGVRESFMMQLQCYRFFNCDFKFSPTDLEPLCKALSNARPYLRRKFFEVLLICHDKMVAGWNATSIAAVFRTMGEAHLAHVHKVIAEMRETFRQCDGDLVRSFERCDADKDGYIDAKDVLRAGYVRNGNAFGVADTEEVFLYGSGLVRAHAQANANSGKLGMEQFVELFGS